MHLFDMTVMVRFIVEALPTELAIMDIFGTLGGVWRGTMLTFTQNENESRKIDTKDGIFYSLALKKSNLNIFLTLEFSICGLCVFCHVVDSHTSIL